MVKDKSYNQIRYLIDSQSSKIIRPLVVDKELSSVIRRHDLDPQAVNKLLIKLNQTRTVKLKRIYNKQAIHLISLQTLNALKQQTIKRFKNLLNLNLLLIPYKIKDLPQRNKSIHEFTIFEKEDELLSLIEELPNSSNLMVSIDTQEGGDNLDEVLQKYDDLINVIISNLKQYQMLNRRLEKYESFNKLLISKLDANAIQQSLVISSNTKIIEQINKSRILVEKVIQKLS